MRKYNCPVCTAELYWDSSAGCLKCQYCDSEYQPSDLEPQNESQNNVQEKPHEEEQREANEQDRATDLSESADLVVYECSHCGAEVITARSTIATTCAFCGRAISMTNKLVGDFKPDSVIPFLIDEEKAKEIYKDYCKQAVLSPKEFKEKSQIDKMKGIFVPVWLHSFQIDANACLNCENVTSSRRGDDKIVAHHMFRVEMKTSGAFESIPADGLKKLDNNLMNALEPYDYSKLSDFNPAYMAGFYAEEYDEDKDKTIVYAKERANSAMKKNIVDNAGTYAVKVIDTYNESCSGEKSKYTMIPVWLMNVTYKNEDYQLAINGETGKIAGKLPVSKKKFFEIFLKSMVAYNGILGILALLGMSFGNLLGGTV